MIEDAVVIYRLSRAPERRVFYIDVGNLPKGKAERYLRDIMIKYRNKMVYDANTGELRDDRKHMSMLEDFWLPRREGGKGTEITTLPAGQNLGQIEDVDYFRKKLLQSLNVPYSRMDQQGGGGLASLGRSAEITRDELKFAKFVNRLRNKFSQIFDNALKITNIFAKETDSGTIKLKFDPVEKQIKVSSQAESSGENETIVPADVEGDLIESAFNCKYLLDLTANLKVENIELSTNSATSPFLFKSNEKENYLHLIMPLLSFK